MIGAVICLHNQQDQFDPAIYTKLRNKPILEYTISNVLRAELVQSIVICAPQTERLKLQGNGLTGPMFRAESFLGRKPFFHFYNAKFGLTEGIYEAAITFNLDTIVIIHADSPLIPPWLINNMLLDYFSLGKQNIVFSNFDQADPQTNLGFSIQVVPFWILAIQKLYAKEGDISFNQTQFYSKEIISNTQKLDSSIFHSGVDLRFTSESNLEQFDYFFSELELGADISDLIKDLYVKQEDIKE